MCPAQVQNLLRRFKRLAPVCQQTAFSYIVRRQIKRLQGLLDHYQLPTWSSQYPYEPCLATQPPLNKQQIEELVISRAAANLKIISSECTDKPIYGNSH